MTPRPEGSVVSMMRRTRFSKALAIALTLFMVISFSAMMLLAVVAGEQSVTAILIDYDEEFYTVDTSTYDSDGDGYDDTVTLQMDVDTWLYIDTPGEYVDVTVDGELYDPDGYLVDSYYTTWTIYGDDVEYGYLYLTATSGNPGAYYYDLYLYDDIDLEYVEDSWSGSIYLYPIGYDVTPDYDEYFYSVTPSTSDSDGDGYDDTVTLQMDVDTTGGYVYVTVYADLDDPYGYQVDSDSTTWSIYGDDTEYGYLYLTATSGDPGYYGYYLDLYDDLAYPEDTWSGSIYLYPIGYDVTPDYDEYFYSVTPSTSDSDGDGYDDSVTLQMDIDTTGGYVYVTVYADLDDQYGYLVDSDSTTWSIYGTDTEYGYLYLTATSGDPGYYGYYLDLYDDLAYPEDSWSGSIYLYPVGYGVTLDYDEYFYSVTPTTSDSDGDGYDDSVTLQIDVDTTGGYIYVSVFGDLYDPNGFLVQSDFTIWIIYGDDTEYGSLYLTATSGDPGYYGYYLELYDVLAYSEDDWTDSVYLYPTGYGVMPTPTPTPIPSPVGGGLSGGAVAGIVVGALIVVVPGLIWSNRSIKRRRATNTQIRELKASMEQWREEGYDVSDLEDLFK